MSAPASILKVPGDTEVYAGDMDSVGGTESGIVNGNRQTDGKSPRGTRKLLLPPNLKPGFLTILVTGCRHAQCPNDESSGCQPDPRGIVEVSMSATVCREESSSDVKAYRTNGQWRQRRAGPLSEQAPYAELDNSTLPPTIRMIREQSICSQERSAAAVNLDFRFD